METILNEGTDGLNLDRSNWQLVKFGDVAIQQKQNVDRENTKLTRYVKGEHMYSNDMRLREWGELKDEYLGPAFIRVFKEGDILYGSRRTYLRKVTIAPFDGITSNTTFVVKADEDFLDKKLLPYLMLSEGFSQHSIRNSKGSVNPYVNWKDLSDYEFLLPPKDQQVELAELLGAVNEVVESGLICSQKVLDFKYNLILDRIKKYSVESKYVTFADIGSWASGGTPSKKTSEYWDNGDTLWITPKDMKGSKIKSSIDMLSGNAVISGKAKLFKKGSIVLVWRSGILQHTLPIAKVEHEFTINQDLKVFLPNQSNFLDDFIRIYLIINAEKIRRECVKEGTTVQSLNTDSFMKYKIPVLSIRQQKAIVSDEKLLVEAYESYQASLEASKTLQKSLISQVF